MKHFVLIVLFGCLLNVYCIAQKKQFQLNLKVGEEYKLALRSRIGMLYPDSDYVVYAVDYRYAFLVTAAKKDVFEMDVKQTSATVAYQSTNDKGFWGSTAGSNPLSQILTALQEKVFKIKIDKNGKVLGVSGYGKICDDIQDNFTDKQTAGYNVLKSMGLNFTGIMTDEEFGQRIQEAFSFLPKEPVQIEDTWSKKVKVDLEFFNYDVDMKYQLKKMGPKISYIEGTAAIEQRGLKTEFVSKADDSLDESGTLLTTISVNNDSGWIELVIQKIDLKGKGWRMAKQPKLQSTAN